MSARTHGSSWRFLVAIAPLLGAAFLVFALAQGEPDVVLAPVTHAVLAGVACIGTLIAWSVARRLRGTPLVSIATSPQGYVAIRGTASPLPDATLVSTGGRPCVWFERSEGRQGSRHASYRSFDSAHPFVLRDGSGSCLVAPRGASISGGIVETDGSTRERRIEAGAELYVVGQFHHFPSSRHQTTAGELGASEVPVGRSVEFGTQGAPDPTATARIHAELAAAGNAQRQELERARLPSLPLIAVPDGIAPFIIAADDRDGGLALYTWLARLDASVAAASLLALWYL